MQLKLESLNYFSREEYNLFCKGWGKLLKLVAAAGCFISFFYYCAGGDISAKNIWLAESMLDIFIENR